MKKSFFYLVIASMILLVVNCQQQNTAKSPKLVTAADSAGYAIGILVGNNNKQQINNAPGGEDINLEAMTAGFRSASLDEEAEMTVEEANSFLGSYFEQAGKEAGQENLESGNSFLEQNKSREGVNVTPSGLQYEVLKQGSGEKPDSTDRVRVHYHGTLVDGTVFDSSVDRGEPAVFGVNQVIPGWTEALQMMPVGSKWKIYIPSELAYGERGAGNDIGPNSTLIFDVELLEIVE
jgi:FKBP-type peptidyl-prolyl cis-trans isomerase